MSYSNPVVSIELVADEPLTVQVSLYFDIADVPA